MPAGVNIDLGWMRRLCDRRRSPALPSEPFVIYLGQQRITVALGSTAAAFIHAQPGRDSPYDILALQQEGAARGLATSAFCLEAATTSEISLVTLREMAVDVELSSCAECHERGEVACPGCGGRGLTEDGLCRWCIGYGYPPGCVPCPLCARREAATRLKLAGVEVDGVALARGLKGLNEKKGYIVSLGTGDGAVILEVPGYRLVLYEVPPLHASAPRSVR